MGGSPGRLCWEGSRQLEECGAGSGSATGRWSGGGEEGTHSSWVERKQQNVSVVRHENENAKIPLARVRNECILL